MAEEKGPKPKVIKKPPTEKITVPMERLEFKSLLLKNPNYFGNLPDIGIKPVKKIVGDTSYERITCLGFNPLLDIVCATVEIRLPAGYGGNLCSAGTTEYVHFYIDYGAGWEDLGDTAFKVYNIPSGHDCADKPNKPLVYNATLHIDPNRQICSESQLPKLRAILSWETIPPAGDPDWPPVWGNVVDHHIQIKPRARKIKDIADILGKLYDKKIKLPPELVYAEEVVPPIPDPPPVELADLVKLYSPAGVKKAAGAGAVQAMKVEPKRFAFDFAMQAAQVMVKHPQMTAEYLNQFKMIDLDLLAILQALDDTKADVSFEELDCLGLDYNREMLAATFSVKKHSGYSGSLCQKGSLEYVSFWVDWEDSCKWTYEGTVSVPAYDIPDIPADGLHYTVFMPVYLNPYRRGCSQPRISRVRAVLSWNAPPSMVDPDALPVWGNRLDAHVLVKPGKPSSGVEARVRTIGGVAIEDIDYGAIGTAMTKPWAEFAFYDIPVDLLGRICPFGGVIWFTAPDFFPGFTYRIGCRRELDPAGTVFYLNNKIKVLRKDFGSDTVTPDPATGWTTYLNPALYAEYPLGYWSSSGDEVWVFWMEIGDMAWNLLAKSNEYRIQLDNTAPTVDIHISGSGDCKDFDELGIISGTFVAEDAHFGAFSLSTAPNTVTYPSNPPTTPLLSTSPTPVGGGTWTLDTKSPKVMKPCGYTVHITARDRSILHSVPYAYNWNTTSVGFCLREKKVAA